MVHRKLLKFTFGLTIGLLIAGLAVFNTLLLWVATGPRSLDKLTPYIENAFQSASNHYGLKIGQTWLIWDGWQHPIDIRLRNVAVLNDQGEIFSSFPEISLGIDIWSLPLGRVLPTSVSINHPTISLYQAEDRSISFGFGDNTEEAQSSPMVPFAALLEPLLSPSPENKLYKLRNVTIHDADINVGNFQKGVFFEARDVEIMAERDRGNVVRLTTGGYISYAEYQSSLSAEFIFGKNLPSIEGQLSFGGLMPGILLKLFSDVPQTDMVNMPFTGTAAVSITKEGIIDRLKFQVEGGQGQIESDKLAGAIKVDALSANGTIDDNFKEIQIDNLLANLDSMALTAKGHATIAGDDSSIVGEIALQNVPADKVKLIWPPKLSPMSREWVTENITEGVVPNASARFNIQPGDIAKPLLPREAVDASIALQGGKIRYIPEHPAVNDVNGVIHIDGVGLTADITSGRFLKETALSGGKLTIADLNADNPRIAISFDGATTAKEAAQFLKLPRVNHAESLNLQPDLMSGTATLSAALEFDFFAPVDANGKPLDPDIKYDVKAEVKDAAMPGFMKRFDIRDAKGALAINNDTLTFKGAGNVNGAEVSEADIRYLFHTRDQFDTFIDAKAITPFESLPKFGYPRLEPSEGLLGVDASVKLGPKVEQYKASIVLDNASVVIPQFTIDKPIKQPGTFDVVAERHDEGPVHVSAFKLKSKDLDASGDATLKDDLSGFSAMHLQHFTLGPTKLNKLVYEPINDGFRLEAEGSSADISGLFGNEPGKGRHFSFANFPAIAFKANIDHLILGPGREIKKFVGEMDCSASICASANVSGIAGDKPVSFRILRNPKGKRQLSLHAENASAFLRALNIYDDMEGGDLTIIGNYSDGKPSVLKGKVDITEYTVRKAPILAKILSLASLTGFFDTLQGNGIMFKRLNAPFTLANDVITFENGKTFGPAIGLTVEGTITMPDFVLDLNGTVVPSYTLNTVLGKVPLFGAMLTGGEGQGVFAARYSVRGTEDKPEVHVNPLSILTPGFLRGLFDIMQQPKSPADTEEE